MPQSIPYMKRWIRGSARGTPRHFAVIGVSGADPIMFVYPEPVTAPTEPFQFHVAMYTKHRVLATADASIIPMYNAQLVEQGLYVKLLLEESGGEPTPHVQAALVEYERMKREELNRFNYDTGERDTICVGVRESEASRNGGYQYGNGDRQHHVGRLQHEDDKRAA